MEEPSTETTEDNRQTNLKLNKRRLVPFRTRKSVRTNLMGRNCHQTDDRESRWAEGIQIFYNMSNYFSHKFSCENVDYISVSMSKDVVNLNGCLSIEVQYV